MCTYRESTGDSIKSQWEKFITTGKVDSEIVRQEILLSWQRCRRWGINSADGVGWDILKEEELKELISQNAQLLEIAKPYMQTLYQSVQGSGFMVVLTDARGRILHNCGDSDILNEAEGTIQFVKGANWSEEAVGTNAIGTALALKKAIQISGAEHFCLRHHQWTCSATPVRNPGGQVIGCLDISGSAQCVHAHTLGMIVAAVEAIENQLRKDEVQKDKSRAYELLAAVTGSVTEGLLAIDDEGKIILINPAACSILGLREPTVLGQNLTSVLGVNNNLVNMAKSSGLNTDVEITLDHNGERIHCTGSSQPIVKKDGSIAGLVFSLREIKKVHRLVNRMVGATARFTCKDILGESEQIKKAIKLILVAANSHTNVLLLGESGTGKELFAQAIHNHGNRREGPFVAVNCGALPRELIQSELFGYDEGAFTGAKRGGHPGKFELANEGTVFLDEIGDMPMELQGNLLRVLQEHKIMRVGGEKIIPVNVRIIAATNKDLSKRVAEGSFREDLYYRLNVLNIRIPPLRERGQDIELLMGYFIKMFCVQMGKKIKGQSSQFMETVRNYSWPGNVRELQNALEYAINVAEDDYLNMWDLPSNVQPRQSRTIEKLGILPLSEVEKVTVESTLTLYNGNITKTAKALGIGRNTLYDKLKKLGVRS